MTTTRIIVNSNKVTVPAEVKKAVLDVLNEQKDMGRRALKQVADGQTQYCIMGAFTEAYRRIVGGIEWLPKGEGMYGVQDPMMPSNVNHIFAPDEVTLWSGLTYQDGDEVYPRELEVTPELAELVPRIRNYEHYPASAFLMELNDSGATPLELETFITTHM